MGKRPFAQSISPKKTTEGIIGAFALCFFSAILMWIIAQYSFININKTCV